MVNPVSEIGSPDPEGDQVPKGFGFQYVGTFDGERLYVKKADQMMNHYNAAAWAAEEGGRLPSRKEGKYLITIKDQDVVRDLFNFSGAGPAGQFWLRETDSGKKSINGWCQDLSDGRQCSFYRRVPLQVLCVRR